MNSIFKKILICSLSIILICSLSSCHFVDDYRFKIKNIDDVKASKDYDPDSCLTIEIFNFAKLDNVLFIPDIEYADGGKRHRITVGAVSPTGNESVLIKNVTFKEKENENVLITQEINRNIELKKDSDSMYSGYIDTIIFSREEVKAENDKEYILILDVEVEENGERKVKSITYEVIMKKYRVLVTPT